MADRATWLGVDQVADALGIEPAVVEGIITRGHLPALRVGNVLRVHQGDLARFIQRSGIRRVED